MGIKQKMKDLMGSGKENMKCVRAEDGQIKCSLSRKHQDGTSVELSGFTANQDADCNIVLSESYENEPGALDRLEGKALSRIKGKCANKPADY